VHSFSFIPPYFLGTAQYPSGSSYEGGWKDGKYEGYGVLRLKGGSVYEGIFKEGFRHGFGRLQMPSGNSYEGQFSASLCHLATVLMATPGMHWGKLTVIIISM
jgi:hypothetical protein